MIARLLHWLGLRRRPRLTPLAIHLANTSLPPRQGRCGRRLP